MQAFLFKKDEQKLVRHERKIFEFFRIKKKKAKKLRLAQYEKDDATFFGSPKPKSLIIFSFFEI